MAAKEKGRRKGDPIPNYVLADSSDDTATIIENQAAMLVRRFGLLPATAGTVAALAFATEVR